MAGKLTTLIGWGMPSGSNPHAAGRNTVLIVQSECFHSHPTHRRSSNNFRSILTPHKMLFPSLSTRVKERAAFASLRIESMSLRSFVAIAERTGEPQIFRNRLATSRQGDDMFDVHRHGNNGL